MTDEGFPAVFVVDEFAGVCGRPGARDAAMDSSSLGAHSAPSASANRL
jgi:hypothetical protein